jgi:hypothetical protein
MVSGELQFLAGGSAWLEQLLAGGSSWREQWLAKEVDQLELDLVEDGASSSRDFELEELD